MDQPGTGKDAAGRGAQGTARNEMGVLWGLNVIDTFAQSRGRGHLGQVPLLLVPKEFNKSPIKMIQEAKATEQYEPLKVIDVFCIVSSSNNMHTPVCTLDSLITEWGLEFRIWSLF